MNKYDLLFQINNVALDDLVCLTEINTEEDKHKYADKGYCPQYTRQEVEKYLDFIPAERLFFKPLDPASALYYNKETLAVAVVHLFLLCKEGMEKQTETLKKAIIHAEQSAADKDFLKFFFALQDGVKLSYLCKIIDKFGDELPDLYDFFFEFYSGVDFGFKDFTADYFEKVVRTKTPAQKAKTTKAMKELDHVITIYRGEGSKSTPTEQAYSWSLDENIANFFAIRMGDGQEPARLVKAQVAKSKVVEYYTGRGENEIIVRPQDVEILDVRELYSNQRLNNGMPTITDEYFTYKEKMMGLDFSQRSNIHGIEHENRVLLLALLLAFDYGLSPADSRVLAMAAIYHDTKRIHDGVDDTHGKASREYYEKNEKGVNDLTGFLIEYHCKPDAEAYEEIKRNRALSKNRTRAKRLFDIFKDADALDRVRLGLKDMDLNQLRVEDSKKYTLLARVFLDQMRIDG